MAEEFQFPDEKEKDKEQAPELEIEVIDDTPPEDRGREPLAENPDPDEEELASYSDRVKKRIHTLQKAYHDALAFANSIIEKNKSLVKKTNTDATLLHETWKSKTESDLENAKKAYKSAYESGDSDALLEAQEALNRATIRHENSLSSKPALQEENFAVEDEKNVYTAPPPDENAVAWAKKNSWFGKDRVMTGTAYGIHEDLIATGIHPQRDATKYYEEINKQMRVRFPDYNWGDSGVKEPRSKTTANVVAPVTRTASGSKKVALTKTQVALAKKWNIPLEEYARQVQVLNGENNG